MQKQFYVNQNVLWITRDFEGRHVTRATITKVTDTKCYARTNGNNNNSDDMNLLIDASNEMDFFDLALQESIHVLKW